MGYVVGVKKSGKWFKGKRIFKTLAGAQKSINSPAGKEFVRNHNKQFKKPIIAVKAFKKG